MAGKETKTISPSKATAAKTIFEAFKILKAEGGELHGKEVIDRIRKNLQFSDWEKTVYEKTGYIRWEAIFTSQQCLTLVDVAYRIDSFRLIKHIGKYSE